jgi:hypothetical protein
LTYDARIARSEVSRLGYLGSGDHGCAAGGLQRDSEDLAETVRTHGPVSC